ncbi:MAG TPA: protein kinase [Fimbriiglobus sp.]|nr:protein kinase [Fimbriiglobus sp.]
MTTSDDTLTDLLARWEERWEHGEDTPAADLCADRPELAEALQRKIDRLKRMAWMVGSGPDDEEAGGSADPLVGTTLAGRYKIEGFVAEGGFGRVYRATDLELHRPVAVKVARRGKEGSGRTGLLDEARRAAGLRHPGIVPVYDVGADGDVPFVVSELIDGPDLATLIGTNRPTAEDAARIVAGVADALQFAHGEGFVHRDIKPANVLLDRQGRPFLTDFGLAASFEQVLRRDGVRSGTLAYMSPEQVAGETQLIGPRSDIYSLGVVLYELLTGRLPYQARTPGALREQILFRPPVPVRVVNPSVSAELEAVCLRCLSKLPADRFPSAAELASALRAAPPRSRLRLSRRWAIIALVVTAIFVAGILLGSMLASHRHSEQPPSGHVVHEEGVFVFDGGSRIVTPLERFAPVTLEAWVRVPAYPEHSCQFVVGSDVPTKHGIGLALCRAVLSAEFVAGMYHSPGVVPLDRWTHVAGVFGRTETRLYVGGKLVGTGPATRSEGGTAFVVGNVGRDNPIDYFRGRVRSVRISSGERYRGDFVPDEAFVKDAEGAPVRAVLIYDGGTVEGDRVIDLSGNGNHGLWEHKP